MLKKTYALLLMSFLAIQPLQAKDCFQLDDKSFSVKWEAYKTPAKVGVGGSFTDYRLKGDRKAESLEKLLKGLNITIDTDENSVETGNQPRDVKIANAFFSEMADKNRVKGKVTSVSNKDLTLNLTMNGVTRDVPMSYTLKGDKFRANGIIDVFDFDMMTQLEAMTKACQALHQGKTWNDVKVSLEAQIDRDC